MESLEFTLSQLDPPWGRRIRSILVDSSISSDANLWPNVVSTFAFVTKVVDEGLQCELGFHEPFLGPKLFSPVISCLVTTTSLHGVSQGMWVGFCNAIVVTRQPPKFHLDQKSVIWTITNLEPKFGTVNGHLFAGAFSGWERAFNWCKTCGINNPMFSYAVDSDPKVGRVWAQHENTTLHNGLIPMGFKTDSTNVMFTTEVQNKSWYNVNRFVINLFLTASPPCQSWSLGGKKTGLHSENGISFIECIDSVRWVRPIALLLECSDQVPHHKHYEVIKQCLAFAGYRQHWSQVVSLDGMTGMVRTRWLAVWIRHDVFSRDVPPPVKLAQVSPHFWNDEECKFFIPADIKNQLCLDDDLLGFYGNFDLLPPNKKAELGPNHNHDQVLHSRCLAPKDKMPTLCAQYSKQHLLSGFHLREKGIYASLMKHEGQVMFFDPFRFVNLLGNPKDQVCVLSHSIVDAFHHLGNAISIQHAFLTIKIALLACGIDKSPVMEAVVQSWQNRMTSFNAIVITKDDFIYMTPIAKIQHICEVPNPTTNEVPITFGTKTSFISRDCSFHDFFSKLGIQHPDKQGIEICVEESIVSCFDKIVNHAGRKIAAKKDDQIIFPIDVSFEVAFPTQKWTSQHFEENDIKDEDVLRHVIQVESTVVDQHESNLKEVWIFILGNEKPEKITIPFYRDEQDSLQCILQQLGYHHSPNQVQWFHAETTVHSDCCEIYVLDFSCICRHPNKCIIVHNSQEEFFPIVVSSEVAPSTIALRCNFQCTAVCRNKEIVMFQSPIKVEHGDVLRFYDDEFQHGENSEQIPKRFKSMVNPQPLNQSRIEMMIDFGPKLGTDEMSFVVNTIRKIKSPLYEIADACIWEGKIDFNFFTKLTNFVGKANCQKTLICPILLNDHWGAIEVSHSEHGVKLKAVNINYNRGHDFLKRILRMCPEIKQVQHFLLPAIDGFCGWALLAKWCKNAGVDFPDPATPQVLTLISEGLGKNLPWGFVSSFALKARYAFITQLAVDCHDQSIRFGGSPETADANMTPNPEQPKEKGTDPWLKYDPWSNKQKQCRWEDLSLPSDHPFHDSHDQRIEQVHRHALNANNNGISFCTRAAIPDILSKLPKQPFALVVPASDKIDFQPPPGATASKPQEIIVQDGSTGMTYKRQVLLVQTDNQVQVKLPKPGISATLTEKHEVVLEAHTNLLPKDSFHAVGDRHLEIIKTRAYEQFPALQREKTNIYGFRKFQDPANKEKTTLQAMTKVTKETRIAMLESSGVGDIFVRDFISKGMQPTDTTIIPKFWMCDRQGKDEALRASASIDGFAGIVVTRRGIATRSWCNRISNVRKVLLASDERICDMNLSVVPHHMYNSTGWPLSIGPQDIVKVVKQTCGFAPVPTRCFKMLGVTTWTLGFDGNPTNLKFTAQFNGIVYEILLSKIEDENHSKKGGKGSNNKRSQPPRQGKGSADPRNAASSTPSDERLTTLEAKM